MVNIFFMRFVVSTGIIDKIVSIVGSKAALAKALNTTKQNVNQWKEKIPIKYCPDIERVTSGVVKCEEMRPEVNWSFLRKSKK